MHRESHPLAGQSVVLNDNVARDVMQGLVKPGKIYQLEDWWDRISGNSWMNAGGNFAAMHYAARSAFELPMDDEVVYGHIGNLGHIVHISELGDVLESGV